MNLMNSPTMVLIWSFVAMALAALLGDHLRTRLGGIDEEESEDFNLVLGATVTLLALAHRSDRSLFLILLIAVAISFFLISDIDSPRGGAIRVVPQNLLSLAQSLRAQ